MPIAECPGILLPEDNDQCGTCPHNLYRFVCREHGEWIYLLESARCGLPAVINRGVARTHACFENMDLTRLGTFCKHGNHVCKCPSIDN